MEEGYCFKCRQKREIRDPQYVTLANNRSAVCGFCPVCDTKISRFKKENEPYFPPLEHPADLAPDVPPGEEPAKPWFPPIHG